MILRIIIFFILLPGHNILLAQEESKKEWNISNPPGPYHEENIRNTESVQYTMVNGRLYDANTLNEIGNYDRQRSKFYWELEGSREAYPFFHSTGSFMQPSCMCGQ